MQTVVPSGVAAVINTEPCSTGAYPSMGPLLLARAGVHLVEPSTGLWLATVLSDAGAAVAVASLVAIALYAKVLSLSALIERMPPLRVLDWLGRRNPDA